jgi:hypothetical protein
MGENTTEITSLEVVIATDETFPDSLGVRPPVHSRSRQRQSGGGRAVRRAAGTPPVTVSR